MIYCRSRSLGIKIKLGSSKLVYTHVLFLFYLFSLAPYMHVIIMYTMMYDIELKCFDVCISSNPSHSLE